MKRIICVLLVIALSLGLASCGSGSSSNSGQGSAPAQNNSDAEPSSNAAGSKDTGKQETKVSYTLQSAEVVSTDECSLLLSSVKDGRSSVDFAFSCENKTSDKRIMFSMEEVTVNGYVIPSLFAKEVASGKKATETISISKSTLSEYGIDSVDELGMDVRIYDSDDWLADEFVEDHYALYPTGKTAADIKIPERKKLAGEQVVFENENGTFVIYGAHEDKIWGYTLSVFMQNKTDSKAMFSWEETSVNGYMCDPFWAKSLPAGSCAYSEISFSKSDLEKNNITKVEEIEFEMNMSGYLDVHGDPYVKEVFTYKP